MKFYTIGYGGRNPTSFSICLRFMAFAPSPMYGSARIGPPWGHIPRPRTRDKGIERLLDGRGISYHPILELGNLFFGLEDWRTPYRELLRRCR